MPCRSSGAAVKAGDRKLTMTERFGSRKPPARSSPDHVDQGIARVAECHLAPKHAGHIDIDVLAHGPNRARVATDLDDRKNRIADHVTLTGGEGVNDVAAGGHQR